MGRSRQPTSDQSAPPTLDARIASLVAEQHGVVALRQLEALGLTRQAAHARAAAGRLHRIHRGVYAVGHTALSSDARRMAAVLACGDGAALSYCSAGRAWGFLGGSGARIDVTTASRSGHGGPPDVVLHRTRCLPPEDVTTLRGVPITTVARTLVDLADVLTRDRLDTAVHEGQVLRLLDIDALARTAERLPGRRGRRRLLAVLAHYTAAAPQKNDLERRFRRLCANHGLPRPKTNTYLDIGWPSPTEIDALFADAKVIVELDGAATHQTRRAFERDRAKDAALAALGYVVVRITWRRLTDEPDAVAAELRQTLRARMTQFHATSSRSPGTFMTGLAHGQ